MVIVLLLLGVGAWLVGVVTLSQATAGVGAIASGCFFAILARMAQSDQQHRKLFAALVSRVEPR